MTPVRIRRRRTKGWRMPRDTVYVGRGSKWGNPFRVGVDGDARRCVALYAADIMPYTHRPPRNTLEDFFISEAMMREIQSELRGKNLACWCSLDDACHADFLLDIANMPIDEVQHGRYGKRAPAQVPGESASCDIPGGAEAACGGEAE